MSGQRLYNQYQTAYLKAGTHTLEMTDTYGDGWNGNTIFFIDQNGVTVDSATLNWGSTGTSDIDIQQMVSIQLTGHQEVGKRAILGIESS